MEREGLKRLLDLERLAERKARIYSRLLTDVRLAKELEEMSSRHESRKGTLEKMAQGVVER